MTTETVTADVLAQAVQRGRTRAEDEFRAEAVRYRPEDDAIEIVTLDAVGFVVPRAWIAPLAGVPPEDLAHLEVWPGGSAFEVPRHDVHVSIHGLLIGILPRMVPAQTLAALFARRGGAATSAAKRASARANGSKGGRPRKLAASS